MVAVELDFQLHVVVTAKHPDSTPFEAVRSVINYCAHVLVGRHRVVVRKPQALGADFTRRFGAVVGCSMPESGGHLVVLLPAVLAIHHQQVGIGKMGAQRVRKALGVLVIREEHEHLAGRSLLEAVRNSSLGVVRLEHADNQALLDRMTADPTERQLLRVRGFSALELVDGH